MEKIRIALVGVGNCASGLVQGIFHYSNCRNKVQAAGLRYLTLAGYHPRDIEIVSAFDIDSRKVGKDLSEAIFAQPNNTRRFVANLPEMGVQVKKGPILDGVGEYLKDVVEIDPSPEVSVAEQLKKAQADIVINLLPSGAVDASRMYASETLKAGCAFVNATPVSIANDPNWSKQFKSASIPIAGDDLIDQVGATAIHKTLLGLLLAKGVQVSETYQLDVGGGTESLNTLERTRETKRRIKTKTVKSVLPYEAAVVAGTTDYVDFLQNRRDSYIWIEGHHFGGSPFQIELRLSTIDAANAGSVLIDVIRAVKVAQERGDTGPIASISAYAFKSPPQPLLQENAEKSFEDYINRM